MVNLKFFRKIRIICCKITKNCKFLSKNLYLRDSTANQGNVFFKFFTANFININYFAIIFKIKFSTNDIRSCSSTQVAHINSINQLYSIFSRVFFEENFAEAVSDDENHFTDHNTAVNANILFSFKPLKNIKNTKFENFFILEEKKNVKTKNLNKYVNDFKYKGFSIPTTMDLYE